jgi:BASS family bile acid:Na+ symporter
MILKPAPSIVLGMILVASCPSGNISNFLVNYSRGNTALSVTIAAFSMLGSIVFTPFNLAFWGELNPYTRPILHSVSLSPWQVLGTIVVLLGVPTALGMWVSHRYAGFAERARGPFRILSLAFFVLFVVGALVANWGFFMTYVQRVVLFVFLLNAFALLTGYYTARLARLPEGDRRAVSLEVGIQNSGFGLALVFNFFGGLGGMAIVAAWWGIWHLLAGLTVSSCGSATAGGLAGRVTRQQALVTDAAGYPGVALTTLPLSTFACCFRALLSVGRSWGRASSPILKIR